MILSLACSSQLEGVEEDSLEQQLVSMLETVQALQTSLSTRDNEMEAMLGEVGSLKGQLQEREEEVVGLQASLTALQDVIAMTKSDLEAVTEDYTERLQDLEAQVWADALSSFFFFSFFLFCFFVLFCSCGSFV
jgi:peptidoglycan hydrolase CwlO-like protein